MLRIASFMANRIVFTCIFFHQNLSFCRIWPISYSHFYQATEVKNDIISFVCLCFFTTTFISLNWALVEVYHVTYFDQSLGKKNYGWIITNPMQSRGIWVYKLIYYNDNHVMLLYLLTGSVSIWLGKTKEKQMDLVSNGFVIKR